MKQLILFFTAFLFLLMPVSAAPPGPTESRFRETQTKIEIIVISDCTQTEAIVKPIFLESIAISTFYEPNPTGQCPIHRNAFGKNSYLKVFNNPGTYLLLHPDIMRILLRNNTVKFLDRKRL